MFMSTIFSTICLEPITKLALFHLLPSIFTHTHIHTQVIIKTIKEVQQSGSELDFRFTISQKQGIANKHLLAELQR